MNLFGRLLIPLLVCVQLPGADPTTQLVTAAKKGDEDAIMGILRKKVGTAPSKELVETIVKIGVGAPNLNLYRATRKALAGIRAKESIKTLGDMAKSTKDYRVCVLAIDALADIPSPETVKYILPLLKKKDPRIAVSAAKTLGTKPHADSVEGLLESLPKADRIPGELSLAIRQSLYKLTDKNFRSYTDWEKWWKTVKATWKPPTEREIRGRTALSKVKPPGDFPRFFGMEIYSLKVVFVIDVSGSMTFADPQYGGQSRIQLVKEELIKVVRELRGATRFCVVAFSDRIRTQSKSLMGASRSNKAKANAWIGQLSAAGATWTQEALEKAFTFKDANTIVVLSDGAPAKGGGLTPTKPILEWVQHANRFRKATIHTISFPGANVPFMQELATGNKGSYRDVGSGKAALPAPEKKQAQKASSRFTLTRVRPWHSRHGSCPSS